MPRMHSYSFSPLQPLATLALTSILALAAAPTSAQANPNACPDPPAMLSTTVPQQDWPTLAQAYSTLTQLNNSTSSQACFSIDLYYSHSPNHFQKARYCVLGLLGLIQPDVDLAKVKQAQTDLTGGATSPDADQMDGLVLAMLYANGEGVARNLPVARQLLCEYSAGIQSQEPAQNLTAFNKIIRSGGHFDVCADQGGGFGREANYVCLGLELNRQAQDIHRRELAISAASSPPIKSSFLALQSAWQAFHKAYTTMDATICDGGTGCGPITEDDNLAFTTQWLSALKDIQQAKAPSADTNPSTFPQLDHALNTAYQQTLNLDQDCKSEDCIAPQVRAVGRAWLKYREAWVQFGALRWPNIPADQWRAWQTAEWTALLTAN